MRRHLSVPLVGAAAVGSVDRWRCRWDPLMAALVPAHVTVVYPEETADENLLLHRAADVLSEVAPFRLRLGAVFTADGGRGGVFVTVDDVDGGWASARGALLRSPMRPVEFPPHVTIAHPRTASRPEMCFAALAGQRLDVEVVAEEIVFTETTASSYTVLRRFPLAATPIA